MSKTTFEKQLSKTLEDRRLSRNERQALQHLLRQDEPTSERRRELLGKAFAAAQRAMTSHADRQVLAWLQEVSKLLVDNAKPAAELAEAFFEPHQDCGARLISLLDHSRSDIRICVFTITDNAVAGAILAAHRRGVTVRIISDGDKARDRGSDIARLETSGVPVRVDFAADHMHHKFAVFDSKVVVTGSYNWTRGAAERNLENIIVCDESRLVRPFVEEFERLWQVLGLEPGI